MHKIGKTGRVNLEDRAFEVELKPHHRGQTHSECESDAPKGWEIPSYWLLQSMRNDPKIRGKFSLIETWECVQNPDVVSRKKGYVARFYAYSDGASLDCDRDPSDSDAELGVRYAREISKK